MSSKPKTAPFEILNPKGCATRVSVWQVLFSRNSMQPGARGAPAVDAGEPEWPAYSGARVRKFLRLDQFLKSAGAKAEENVYKTKS